MKKLIMLLCVLVLAASCGSAPAIRKWDTANDRYTYNQVFNASRIAVVQTGFGITSIDKETGTIIGEKVNTTGFVFKDHHVRRLNVFVNDSGGSITVDAGVTADNNAWKNHDFLDDFADNLKSQLPFIYIRY